MKNIMIPAGSRPVSGVIHSSGSSSDKTLIISHGFRGTKDGGGRATLLAETIAAAGVSVIRYDFTPLQSLSCQIAELTAVVDYARQTVSSQIMLLGRSMGGSASLAVAAADQKISGLILWATPWDLITTFRLALGAHYEHLTAGRNLHLTDQYGNLFLTPDFIRDFQRHDLLAYAKQLTHTSLLMLHGTADIIVPVCQAHTIYNMATGPRELKLYQDGDHHLSDHSTQASADIVAWLRKAFPSVQLRKDSFL
ncbi:alpha/beta hydrolase [Sporomusa sp.]|uniref:alpha/beta hydrolase n=1 Tax=Sporomusa sp. TaxID=2078658 RepID=UPI002D100939|nr:acetylxylan esterase [Sporomusa sp.]HWR44999.1 acetylxylan esterase [Sporomusa sp.]